MVFKHQDFHQAIKDVVVTTEEDLAEFKATHMVKVKVMDLI